MLELLGYHVHVQPEYVVEGHLVPISAEYDERLAQHYGVVSVSGAGLPADYQVDVVGERLQELRAGFLAELCQFPGVLDMRVWVS